MAIEIERKYLLINEDWRQLVSKSTRMTQGYLCRSEIKAIRVRIAADQAHIDIKQSIDGIHRHEFEYDIPVKDAEEILKQTTEEGVIDKTRHLIVDDDLTWEIDEFHGNNAGLIVAEIELPSADHPVPQHPWLGKEVSTDMKYFNSHLISHPYKDWSDEEKS